MGSVRRAPRNPKRWEARYTDTTGQYQSKTFDAKADADAWLRENERSPVSPRASRISYAEWCDVYFAGAVHKRATTLARDRIVNDKHFLPVIGARHLSSLTPLDVRRLVEALTKELAPSTVRTNYGVLSAILSAAVDAEVIAVSPCRGVKLPPERRSELRFLSAEELVRLGDATPVEYRPAVYLAGVLGLRFSEVAGLRVGRIDFLRHTLAVVETCAEVDGKVTFADVKSKSSRRVLDVPPFLGAMLAEHLARRGRPGPGELVLVAPEDGPLRRSTFRTRVFNPAARRASLDGLTFHALRHSAVGLMIEAGAHPEAIKARLGHASIRTTSDVYGHVLPGVDAGISAALEERFGAGMVREDRDSR
jgi:integrase